MTQAKVPAIDPCITAAFAIAERIARNCIPELKSEPIYIVQPQDDSLVTREMMGGWGGLYRHNLDLTLQPMLESTGQWRGRGVAIVIDGFNWYVMATNDDDGRRNVVGAVLHELTHWLDWPLEPVSADTDDTHEAFVAACEKTRSQSAKSSEFPPGFFEHEESFSRLSAHLWYRASHGGGMILQHCYLRFGSDYRGLEMLPSPVEMTDALGDELEMFQGLPLRLVARLPTTTAYTELWNRAFEKMFTAKSIAC